jgi:ABC-2 type transport system permease protein
MSASTTSAISLEGKSRWLMCSAPVQAKVIFDSKIAVSLTYLVPSVLISCTLFAVSLKTGFVETIALFAIPLLFSAFISVVGLAFNLKFPKYDWTSETQAVKQSTAVIATLGIGFGSAAVLYILSILLMNTPIITYLLAIALVLPVTMLVYKKISVRNLYI